MSSPRLSLGGGDRFNSDDDDEYDLDELEQEEALQQQQQDVEKPWKFWNEEEATIVKRKLDLNLVLFVSFLYMLSFLDRGNLGNAKLAGLTTDLRIQHFSSLLTAFYTPYILFQPLSHLYTFLPPHLHITVIVALWGVISSLQSLCTSLPPLLALRFLLGVSEAAFAGIPIYLSSFYARDELAFRLGVFIAAAPLASSFAGTLAAGILAVGHHIPVANWRLLFLLEGFPAVVVSVVTWYWIPDSPSRARWLTPRERKIARHRLLRPTSRGSQLSHPEPQHQRGGMLMMKQIFSPLRDPKSYLLASLFFAVNLSFSSIPVFLPTLLTGMGFSKWKSQALTAPPYLLAAGVVVGMAKLSDRWRSRSGLLMWNAGLAFVAFAILGSARVGGWGEWMRYTTLFPLTSGLFSCVAGIITWQVNNQVTKQGQGTGFAILQMFGQCGSLVGSGFLFADDEEGPFWTRGMWVCAAGMVWVGVGSAVLRGVLKRDNLNRRKRRGMVGEEEEGVVWIL